MLVYPRVNGNVFGRHFVTTNWNIPPVIASRDVISLVAKQANLKRPKALRETRELSLFTVRSILAEPKDGDVKKKQRWYGY